jgi:hypothetical protein
MSGTGSTPSPTTEDDRAAPVKFPLNREFLQVNRGNNPRNREFVVSASLREPRDGAIRLCGIGAEAGPQVIIVLKIAQLDLGGDLKSARLKEARLDRRDPSRRLA